MTPSIEVVDYDPVWPGLAAVAIAELATALSGSVAEIEHIGSTAVPGLAAKPTIDMVAASANFDLVEQRDEELAEHGYHRHVNGMAGRLFYVRGMQERPTHHLHVVKLDTWPTLNQRLLRDYLRKHPEDVDRYARLKWTLAASSIHPDDYTKAKTDLIQELTDRARAELGLPSVPVWEK